MRSLQSIGFCLARFTNNDSSHCHSAMVAMHRIGFAVLICLAVCTPLRAQPLNLLRNPGGELGVGHWIPFGEATLESDGKMGVVFRIRNKGHFHQDVDIPKFLEGKYALLIGRVSGGKANSKGQLTGLPYLHGYMQDGNGPNRGRILAYVKGQHLVGQSLNKRQPAVAWGVFQVPEGTRSLRFFLSQTSRKGDVLKDIEVQFDDLGLYVFNKKEAAFNFANSYQRKQSQQQKATASR